jgi:hypothetical protein
MNWSAPGYVPLGDDWPTLGPPGLRFELLWRWATGGESGTVLVKNTTGVNGWSCVITAMRGGAGSGLVVYHAGGSGVDTPRRAMTAFNQVDLEGYLVTDWFVSRDDNNHGRVSTGGTLAFGGTGYDTTVGTDHAASMSWHVGVTPPCEINECPPSHPPFEWITVRQLANGPDAYVQLSVTFSPIELIP